MRTRVLVFSHFEMKTKVPDFSRFEMKTLVPQVPVFYVFCLSLIKWQLLQYTQDGQHFLNFKIWFWMFVTFFSVCFFFFCLTTTNLLDSSATPLTKQQHGPQNPSAGEHLPLADTENDSANQNEALQKRMIKESMRSFTRSQREKDDPTAAPKCEACSQRIERWNLLTCRVVFGCITQLYICTWYVWAWINSKHLDFGHGIIICLWVPGMEQFPAPGFLAWNVFLYLESKHRMNLCTWIPGMKHFSLPGIQA